MRRRRWNLEDGYQVVPCAQCGRPVLVRDMTLCGTCSAVLCRDEVSHCALAHTTACGAPQGTVGG